MHHGEKNLIIFIVLVSLIASNTLLTSRKCGLPVSYHYSVLLGLTKAKIAMI